MSAGRTFLNSIAGVALICGSAHAEHIAITNPRPLLEAAKTISARSGVPLSYEDPLPNSGAENATPTLLPSQRVDSSATKARAISFDLPAWPEPFRYNLPTTLMEPGNILDAIKVIGDVLSREPANGPFKLRRSSDGRLFLGPNQSLLDIPIHFPGAARRQDPWAVLAKALEQASGFQVLASGGEGWQSDQVEPGDGTARDILLSILEASRHWGAGYSDDAEFWLPKFQWDLTSEPDSKARGGMRFRLGIRALRIEYRDAKGNLHQTSTVTDRVVDSLDADDEP